MKKYKKLTRIISLVFALCMLMSVTGIAVDAEIVFPAEVMQAMEAQVPALEAFQNICDNLPKDSDDNVVYPSEYGGEYVDPDREYKLVLQLTDISPTIQAKYVQWSGNATCLLFEKVAYSVSYLKTFESQVEDLKADGYDVVGWGVSHMRNQFVISLDESEATINFLTPESTYSFGGYSPVVYQVGDNLSEYTDLYGGSPISNKSSGEHISVGVGGTFTTGGMTYTNCFLTCGHGNPQNSIIKYGGFEVGNVIYRRYGTSSTSVLGDFAVVNITNSAFEATNEVYGNSERVTISGSYTAIPTGIAYFKFGPVGGYCTGTVVETNFSWIVNSGITTKGLFVCNVDPDYYNHYNGGDSGGPMYAVEPNGGYRMLGTFVGMVPGIGSLGYTSDLLFGSSIGYAIAAGFQPPIG